jgi:hypothetical protein
MIKPFFFALVSGSALAIAGNAFAQATDASTFLDLQLTPYLQGSIGMSSFNSPSATGMAMDLNGAASKTSLRATAGLQINKLFGIESTWFQLPSTSVNTSVGGANYKGKTYVLSVTGTVPVSTDLDLVGRIGQARSDVNVSVPSTTYASASNRKSLVWGLGARYNLSKSKDLTIDHDDLGAVGKYALGESLKVQVLSIGIKFKF